MMQMENGATGSRKWFGPWKEYGKGYEHCPSIYAFVDPAVNARYNREGIGYYLRNATILAATSRRPFPSPFTGVATFGSLSCRTDGVWCWLDDLADYVERHGVVIPEEWYAFMQQHEFVPPAVDPTSPGDEDIPEV
ncbi:MAG TPA: hypothetical protein VHK69_01510 [Chitinophagaceae bacterium]|nr:hypothetical protein [Chitinophagaceae bacterium]